MVALGPLAPGNCTWKFGPGPWPLALAHRNLQQDHGISWLETETLTIKIHGFALNLIWFYMIFCLSSVKSPAPGPLQFALGTLALANGNLHQNHGKSWLELETLTIEALVFLKWVCFWLMLAPSCVKFDIDPLQFAKGDGYFWHRNLGFLIFVAFKSCGLVLGERKFA